MCTPQLANSSLVSESHGNVAAGPHRTEAKQKSTLAAKPSAGATSITRETFSHCLPIIRKKLENTELSSRTQDIIMAPWRSGTAR